MVIHDQIQSSLGKKRTETVKFRKRDGRGLNPFIF